MKPLTYSDSPFFSNWSQTYFTNLTLDQHIANNNWFMNTLSELKERVDTFNEGLFDELVDNVTQQYPKQLNRFGG